MVRLGRVGEVRGMITGRELPAPSLRIERDGPDGVARLEPVGGLIVLLELPVAV